MCEREMGNVVVSKLRHKIKIQLHFLQHISLMLIMYFAFWFVT